MTISENYPAIHLGGLSNIFHRKYQLCFQEQKSFVLKTMFSHTWLKYGEGVSEGSRSGKW